MAINLTTEQFEATIGTGVSLVDFWADWCGPCKMLGPVIEELAAKYEGKVKVCKVNVDNEEDLAIRFGVMTIPTVILFKDGEELDKRIGVHPMEEFETLLRKVL
ncbi:MAG: thioredoxin [Oscillospiraceae bacterium]|nr:thioredoxin [Oscillospiraceae bacterium]